MQIDDGLLTKRELAPKLGICARTVDEWMKKKRLPYFKIGRTVRFQLSDVLETLNKYRVH